MQAKGAEHAVQHISHAGHVAEVFEDRDQRKHDDDKRHKAHDAAEAVDNAADDERLEEAVGHQGAYGLAKPAEAVFDPSLRVCADHEGQLEHGVQHAEHDKGAEQRVGQHLIQLVGQLKAVLGRFAPDGPAAQHATDKSVTVVGDDGFGRRLQGIPKMIGHGFPVGAQLRGHIGHTFHLPQDFGIVFQHLQGNPAGGIAIRQQPFLGKEPFHLGEDRIEIRAIGNVQRSAPPAAKGDGFAQGVLEPFAGTRHSRHHGDAELFAQLLRVHLNARFPGFIHHIAGQHDRQAHLHDLDGEEQVALKRGGVHQIHDRHRPFLGLFGREHGTGDDFLLRVRRQGIRAGKVHHEDFDTVDGDVAFFLVDGDAGIVPDMLMGSGVFVERRGFPAVRVPRQRNADLFQRDVLRLAAVLAAVRAIGMGLAHATSTVM